MGISWDQKEERTWDFRSVMPSLARDKKVKSTLNFSFILHAFPGCLGLWPKESSSQWAMAFVISR